MSITTAQIRGARGLLNWSQNDLSERTGISGTSIGAIESGATTPRKSSLEKIRQTFENSGIEFMPNQGLRMRSGEVKIFSGREGFWEFYQDIFETVSANPGEVVVSNADERKFEKWLGADNLKIHIDRVKEIKDWKYRILVKEGDNYYLATSDFGEYRWMPEGFFSSVPFYVYGDKLAILIFDNEPTVIVMEYPTVAKAYRAQFDAIWHVSLKPDKRTE